MNLAHDCTTCEKAGNCPLEHLAPVMNEHHTSIQEALERERDLMATMLAAFTKKNPPLLLCTEAATEIAMTSFVLGYATALS